MKIEKLKKLELNEYCQQLGIEVKGVRKAELVMAVYAHQRTEIDQAIKSGDCLKLLKQKITELADEYAGNLKAKVENTQGKKPKTFEIDFLNGNHAIELKWRDATTDGDHITKEHTRVKVIKEHGYTPIRIMFYYPQREQAIKIQDTLKTLYSGVDGEYYAGDEAWEYLTKISGYDLKSILVGIAKRREHELSDDQ